MPIDLTTFSTSYEALAPYRDRLQGDLGEWVSNYWEAQRGRYELLLEYIVKYLKPQENDRLLDVGIFPGFFTLTLVDMGLNVHAIDLDPERMMGIAREKGLTLKSCNIDSEPFPYEDGSFDIVLFNAVLEHLRVNPLQTMREMYRILAPGGRIMVQTPNLGYWVCRLKVLLGMSFDESPTAAYRRLEELGHPGHIRVYQMAELLEMVRHVGFDVRHHGWTHFKRRPPLKPRPLADRLFGVIPSMRRQLVISAVRP